MPEKPFQQFVTSLPTQQNAVDLFDWVCRLPVAGVESGGMALFDVEDKRPQMVLDKFGSIDGFDILELGPLEGAHSYQLEQRGAGTVLGIEASPEFYLKCLIVKEMLGLKSSYLLGDFNLYLEQTERRFDLIFASGVLYHMFDPIHTLYLVARHSPRAFFWTHYIDDRVAPEFNARAVEVHGFSCDYYEVKYDEQSHSRGWAGINPSACRMRQADIVGCLQHFGYDDVEITEDTPNHPGGPAFCVVCRNARFDPEAAAESTGDPFREAAYYRDMCDQLRGRIDNLSQELSALRNKELADAGAKEHLDAVMESTSWKLTAPLRQGKTLLQRWRR